MSRRLLLLALVAVAVAVGAWWWLGPDRGQQPEQIALYGNVDIRQVDLAFKTSERIVGMHVREGQAVHSGDLLAQLDAARAEHSLQRAEAQMAAQAQQLAALEAGSRPEEIERAQAELQAAQAEAQNAQANARRLEDLGRRKLASPEQVDNARALLEAARGRAGSAAAALKLARAGPRPEEIARARALLRAAAAEVALARQTLVETRLHAPVDGVIRDRLAEPGDMAAPGKPVYSLALVDPVWVRAYLPETELGRIHPGLAVQVQTDSFPDKRYRGWVGYISPTAEFTPKTVETTEVRSDLVYQVRVYVCNPENELRLGMPATVLIAHPNAAARPPADPCAAP